VGPVTPSTFPALLDAQLRKAGSRPLVTFYDDATGERVELSVVTYANWVAKTAGLLQDELGLERGGTVLLDLPTHWLGPVWLGAAWSLGLAATGERTAASDVELVVCGPDSVGDHAAVAAQVVALSLLPMGARFAAPLPPGVVDYGAVVWGQPDAFLPDDPPGPDDTAWTAPGVELTQDGLLAAAASSGSAVPGTRLLTDVNPCTSAGLVTLTGPLLGGGGSVWVRNPAPQAWDRRVDAEQATLELRAPAG
jgi:uncharacterized protein (TIGR03089 family)